LEYRLPEGMAVNPNNLGLGWLMSLASRTRRGA
jgi:hypothetical protein